MKYLSKEKLRQEIFEMAEKCDERKWKRTKKTFFVLWGVIYLILLWCALEDGSISDMISKINISDINSLINSAFLFVAPIIVAAFLAGLVLFASCIVTLYMSNNAMKEEKAIAKKMGELQAIEIFEIEAKETKRELNEYKELKSKLNRLRDMVELAIDECRELELHKNLEDEEEEAEITKYQLENLKDWLKLIEMEHNLLKLNNDFDDEEKRQ